MSAELKEVRQRIGSTRQIRRVTSTLQRVAAARGRRDRQALERAERYRAALWEVLSGLAAAAPEAGHPLLSAPRGGAPCLIAFGADRGLCGGFSTLLAEELERQRARRAPAPVRLAAVGRVVQRRARRAGWPLEAALRQPVPAHAARRAAPGGAEPAGEAELRRLVEGAVGRFLAGEYSEVVLVYVRFEAGMRQKPAAERLLPLALAAPPRSPLRLAELEPGAETLLERLLPEYLWQAARCAFLHSLAAENAARQVAMSRATENAGELLEELIMQYRRVRQDSITTEMIELCSGRLEVRRN